MHFDGWPVKMAKTGKGYLPYPIFNDREILRFFGSNKLVVKSPVVKIFK